MTKINEKLEVGRDDSESKKRAPGVETERKTNIWLNKLVTLDSFIYKQYFPETLSSELNSKIK